MFRPLLCASLCASLSITSVAQSTQMGYIMMPINELSTKKKLVKLSDVIGNARYFKGPGSEFSAYLVGRAYETGEGMPSHRPDMAEAVKWYVFAAQYQSRNATYRLGQLMIAGNPAVPDPNSTIKANRETGASLEQWAIAHGYSPATDTNRWLQRVDQERTAASVRQPTPASASVTPLPSSNSGRPTAIQSSTLSPDDATGPLVIVGGLLALLGLAAIAGSNSSTGNSDAAKDDNDQSSAYTDRNGLLKQCTVGELHWVSNSSESGGGHDEFQYVHHMGGECP